MVTTSASSGPKDGSYDAKKNALQAEIDAKRRFIASSLPDWGEIKTRTVAYDRANLTKQLAEKEYEYELMLEKERVDSVVREHEELHPPYTEECPICLDDIQVRSVDSLMMLVCCGNQTCVQCYDGSVGKINNKCPLCRAEFPKSPEESMSLLKKSAENGRHWAQFYEGHNYMNGGKDGNPYPLNKKKAVKWLTLASKQHNPFASDILGRIYKEGDGVEQSYLKAQDLMTKAANLGVASAQLELSSWYYYGKVGFPADKSKAVYYVTLYCGQEQEEYYHPSSAHYGGDGGLLRSYTDDFGMLRHFGVSKSLVEKRVYLAKKEAKASAEYNLGSAHCDGEGGLKKSLYLAKYYFKKSAEGGFSRAYYDYGMALLNLWTVQYNGKDLYACPCRDYCQTLMKLRQDQCNGVNVQGHCAIPQVLHWLRKAAGHGYIKISHENKDAKSIRWEALEKFSRQKCCYCSKERCNSGTFKRCARCKIAWYCGRECQVRPGKMDTNLIVSSMNKISSLHRELYLGCIKKAWYRILLYGNYIKNETPEITKK